MDIFSFALHFKYRLRSSLSFQGATEHIYIQSYISLYPLYIMDKKQMLRYNVH